MNRDEVKDTQKQVDEGTLSRAFAAVELLASAHASRAKDEAGRDLSRIGSGAVLLLVGALFLMFTLLLADALVVDLTVAGSHPPPQHPAAGGQDGILVAFQRRHPRPAAVSRSYPAA